MKFLLLLSILFGTVFGAQALDNEAVKAFMNVEDGSVCRNSPVRGLKIAVIAIENDRGAHCYLSVSSLTPSIFKRLRLRSRPPA